MQYLQAQTSNSFMWTKDDNERFVKSGGYSMIRNRNRKYSSSLIGTNKIWRVTEDWYWSSKYWQLYHWSKHLILQRGKSIVHHADHFRPNSTTFLRWRIFDPNTSEEFMTSIYFANFFHVDDRFWCSIHFLYENAFFLCVQHLLL